MVFFNFDINGKTKKPNKTKKKIIICAANNNKQ